MPITIDKARFQEQAETVSNRIAKVKVMHDNIQRRASENQEQLSFVKDPKTLDKREVKIYAEAQKTKASIEALLTKKAQLYAHKKEVKDSIPLLSQELETQKENYKTFKQKDKVTRAEKNLTQAQKTYGKLRNELKDLDLKITKMQIHFNNDVIGLRKSFAAKAPSKKTTERLYPHEIHQKIESIFTSLPQEKKQQLLKSYQAYDNTMSDSRAFHESIFSIMTEISQSAEDLSTSLEKLNSFITAEETNIESDHALKGKAQKILNERTGLLMDQYRAQSGAVQQARFAIETLIYSGAYSYSYTTIMEVTSQALLLFSPRAAFYEQIRDIIANSSPTTSEASQSEEIHALLMTEEQYVTGSRCVQNVSDKIKTHHMNRLIDEDNRTTKAKRREIDLEIRNLFTNEIGKQKNAMQIYKMTAAYDAYQKMPPRANLNYYQDLKEFLEKNQHDFNLPDMLFDQFLKHHEYKEGQTTAQSISPDDSKRHIVRIPVDERLLMDKVAKEREELTLVLLKKSNPSWTSNIEKVEKEIFPSLSDDNKNALKKALRQYIPNAADCLQYGIKYDPTVDDKVTKFLKNWTQNKESNFQTQLETLKIILPPYKLRQPLMGPIFREDLDNITFIEPD